MLTRSLQMKAISSCIIFVHEGFDQIITKGGIKVATEPFLRESSQLRWGGVIQNRHFFNILSRGLVPRPHPLTRRNGLVNQVEFLGLAHTFATM